MSPGDARNDGRSTHVCAVGDVRSNVSLNVVAQIETQCMVSFTVSVHSLIAELVANPWLSQSRPSLFMTLHLNFPRLFL
ncbi:hypothetical protein L596_028447 [Steinernema carpocapsae]|uniref:Uncharacterized protein n=1 Tax=Steinernema carpocapsae TaxID=34508 RepID=A0A4U5LYH3_STECR|nr:hypothetical protein L596_028447 [Steinernema carpocapsae]